MSHADPARENIPLHLKIEKSDVFVGEPHGRGLSGSVYRGKILSLDKDVAVKVIKSKNPQHIAPVGSADHNAKYTSEIAMLATLRHPNIVEMIGYCEGERGDETYILLELAKGSIAQQSLVGLRTTNLVAHMLRVLDWCHQVAEGLQYLHRENVLHLDLKPSNILLFEDNTVKICDFGISKLLSGERDDTTTAPKAYTARYTSPETRSHNFVSRESDLFSFGCVMLELITGLPPWHHLQSKSALHALHEGQVPSLDDYVWPLPCPKDVQCLVARLLKCDADARASIEEAIKVLEGAVDAVTQQHLPEQPLSCPLDFNWLDGIAECSSLEVAVGLLACYRAPSDRLDAQFSPEDIKNVVPHLASQLGKKFGTVSSDERSLLLYAAQSPVFKIINAALSKNNKHSVNIAYASPMIKRVYRAIQNFGSPYSGPTSRVVSVVTPALIDVFDNFSTHYAVNTPIEFTQFASFKKDLFTAESLNAASTGEASVPLIIFNCDNIAGFDISACSTYKEGEVILLPPSYFTVSQPPYKVQQTVFVHLTFHADRSHAATYLRAQPQQASQASATTQRTQAVQPRDQLSLTKVLQIQSPNSISPRSLTEVLAELAKVAELRKSFLIQEVDPGDTELHTAAQFGNVTAIKALLQLGAKLSAANDAGATPLFKAAQYGHAEAIHVLWELGADVGVPTLSGVTPLLAAVLGNHADAINVLQDCGADAHERVILTNYPARFQPILFAILSDNASALTALLHHKIDPSTPIAITVDGLPQALTVPLLYIAATLGNIAIVNALINFGADVDAVSGDGSTTALHAAAHANHVEVVKALMVHSRNVDKSETALHKCPPVELFAMVRGHVEVVKELQKALKQVSESGHRNYFL